VTVEDRALLSGNAVVQQFARVGTLAMISGNSGVAKDLPPYLMAVGRATVHGVNVVGLRRAGVPAERRVAVKRAFRLLYHGMTPLAECLAELEREEAPEVKRMVEFIRASKRGIQRRAARSGEGGKDAGEGE
jgi:UDP-N-acetylglucosamine acyltransferase